MITPHPQILRAALSDYADARIRQFQLDTDANRRDLEGATYTLCVITGTSEIEDALATADDLLAGRHQAGSLPDAPHMQQSEQTLIA